MEDFPQQIEEEVSDLLALFTQLQTALKEVPVPKKLRDAITGFHVNHKTFTDTSESGDIDTLLDRAQNVGVYGVLASQTIAQMSNLDETVRTLGQQIGELGGKLRKRAEDDPSTFRLLGDPPSPRGQATLPAAAMRKLDQLVVEQEKHDERVKNSLAENEQRLAALKEALGKLDEQAQTVLSKIDGEYQTTLTELESKKEQINSILGHVSGRAIAGDYEKSAAAEKTAADWLRWGSIACMALIALVLGYAFWETISTDFQWQKSLFRVVLAFLLSAPAAYLARESSKHRTQQYHHLQTSLDLKAMTPYLASLPDDLQHKIKSDVAMKLFTGRDFANLSSDSIPINAQELLMELVKKVELPKSTGKS